MKISEAKSIEKTLFFLDPYKNHKYDKILLVIKYAHEGEHRISYTLSASK